MLRILGFNKPKITPEQEHIKVKALLDSLPMVIGKFWKVKKMDAKIFYQSSKDALVQLGMKSPANKMVLKELRSLRKTIRRRELRESRDAALAMTAQFKPGHPKGEKRIPPSSSMPMVPHDFTLWGYSIPPSYSSQSDGFGYQTPIMDLKDGSFHSSVSPLSSQYSEVDILDAESRDVTPTISMESLR